MSTRNRFNRGSGCFTCKQCKKLTRDTGDNGQCQLCPVCYEASCCENGLSDSEHPNPWDLFKDCKTIDEVYAIYQPLIKELEAKNATT